MTDEIRSVSSTGAEKGVKAAAIDLVPVGPLMKLYRSGRLPTERQPTVVEMICSRGNEYDHRCDGR